MYVYRRSVWTGLKLHATNPDIYEKKNVDLSSIQGTFPDSKIAWASPSSSVSNLPRSGSSKPPTYSTRRRTRQRSSNSAQAATALINKPPTQTDERGALGGDPDGACEHSRRLEVTVARAGWFPPRGHVPRVPLDVRSSSSLLRAARRSGRRRWFS